MQWETVIGLEIHAQLATKTKIFSGASTAYGAEPNTQACAVDLGLPGVLPVLNQEVVRMAVKFGMAIEAEVADYSVFARKNYFYPDLPKGYQISQIDHPIVGIGHMDIDVDGQTKRVGVTRAHLEEDAGKSLHEDFHGLTGVDLNRAGTPLLEIVSEPDMRSAKEAVAYMRKIHELVQYLDICDGNMQEGSFRCDANVSIRPVGQEEYGTRTELKNINSFKFVEKAINIEVERQIDIIEAGGRITQETRLYDADKNETRSMRSKEEANDYRYFPDPDLLPVYISDELRAQVKADLPELAHIKRQRFIEQYKLDLETATQLTSSRQLADYFEALITESGCNAKICSNWVTVELSGALNKQNLDISQSPVTHERLAVLLKRISDNTISGKIAKQVFEIMWTSADSADAIIEAQGLKQITDSGAIEAIIDKIIADNQGQVEQYLSGKDKVFGFFVGQTMKASQGKANPGEVNKILKEKLKR
ncbi:Asp-tRNA(Asn)/Glu-tRNA(Gln) amidotransferase GatCAB subunit B [Methylococcaceae bacterium CS1]|nr:Asp-tRNA(Asn)/Glu-tRNA(Gln) amidotransferase subunit GatB [Methyloprofundus sp.]TXK98246.1 Asp-tRNA(Asn)/Glu-tRNA(Gln) amidotransferase GatCAB subunit B [Methylococcaceae bacterium CS4]TXK98460.1 Asp-tRNA(Asn)/Glu-tRNA(Gln) amidotransferase GatCAB subunit B [Methylococcaceae bacterium CS5]TXL06315.1 Asp-tRNA(Asn)/Glu-tRNA(Gln) amidotransferase GatCAB subunit B [Methylococcaceae bacterium CS3]TXL07317.1 Asp-tRNA(Asn)/Glu-tRNA(Gln) amidotransferase GatCAB subunit B [Methylococcaceae bacterium 